MGIQLSLSVYPQEEEDVAKSLDILLYQRPHIENNLGNQEKDK